MEVGRGFEKGTRPFDLCCLLFGASRFQDPNQGQRNRGAKRLLAGHQTAAAAPVVAEPVEVQGPPATAPVQVRDVQAAVPVPQNRLGQHDVRLATQLLGDGLEPLAVLAQQTRNVRETETGVGLLATGEHDLAGDVGLAILQEPVEAQLRRIELGRLRVLHDLDAPVRDEVWDVGLAGRERELQLVHDEQADLTTQSIVLEDRTTNIAHVAARLLDRGDENLVAMSSTTRADARF